MVLQSLDQVGNSGPLLSNSYVDTEQLLLNISGIKVCLLIDDGVDSDGSLSSLSITDDELSLAPSNGHESVDCLQSSLHRLVDRFSGDNSRGFDFNSFSLLGVDWPVTVDGVSQGIEYSTQHFLSDGDVDNGSRSGDGVTLLDLSVITEDDHTHVVGFQIEGHTSNSRPELDHLSGLDLVQSHHSGDTVSNTDDSTEFLDIVDLGYVHDLVLNDLRSVSYSQLLGREERSDF